MSDMSKRASGQFHTRIEGGAPKLLYLILLLLVYSDGLSCFLFRLGFCTAVFQFLPRFEMFSNCNSGNQNLIPQNVGHGLP